MTAKAHQRASRLAQDGSGWLGVAWHVPRLIVRFEVIHASKGKEVNLDLQPRLTREHPGLHRMGRMGRMAQVVWLKISRERLGWLSKRTVAQ